MRFVGASGTLYDAGTDALAHGDLGGAVLLLRAAERLEPRAPDIARNLDIAEARVALARGEESDAMSGGSFQVPIAAGEGWALTAALLLLGALGMARRFRGAGRIATAGRDLSPRRAQGPAAIARRLLDVAGAAGIVAALLLAVVAWYDRIAPEAVVLETRVRLTAPSGQPLPGEPALVAGERIRLGREHEGLVEVRLGGTSVGWARRAAFWRVRDAAGYTPELAKSERNRPRREHD